MDNDSAQAILLLIVLIVILAAVFVPVGAFYAYAFYQKSKRSRIRETVLREQQQLVGSHRCFPVRYASEIRFKAPFKLFPWEGAGIIVIAPGSVLFLGQTNSGAPVMLNSRQAIPRSRGWAKPPGLTAQFPGSTLPLLQLSTTLLRRPESSFSAPTSRRKQFTMRLRKTFR